MWHCFPKQFEDKIDTFGLRLNFGRKIDPILGEDHFFIWCTFGFRCCEENVVVYWRIWILKFKKRRIWNPSCWLRTGFGSLNLWIRQPLL